MRADCPRTQEELFSNSCFLSTERTVVHYADAPDVLTGVNFHLRFNTRSGIIIAFQGKLYPIGCNYALEDKIIPERG